MFTLAICPILMAIHKLFSKILLMQTYHTTCVSYSYQFSKTGVYRGIPYFLIFALKFISWVPVVTAVYQKYMF